MSFFDKYFTSLSATEPIKSTGTVERVEGLMIQSEGPIAVLGEECQIEIGGDREPLWAEVVALEGSSTKLMTHTDFHGMDVGARVIASGSPLSVPVSDELLGRVVGSRGRPIDELAPPSRVEWRPAFAEPVPALTRPSIRSSLATGVRAIDGILTVGRGQRVGIFSGSGVGKSTLLGMIARNTEADVSVIALIGERGRELRDFIDYDLGPEGTARSVVVFAASDEPPLARLRAAMVATTIAEYFRDRGKHVMLLFDSVTRVARAQREIGLAVGEPPANRGFTPSVFAMLPQLLERSGPGAGGSVTGFYTILVEGDDLDEPIADNVRGILDGHIVLSRGLAERAHYPAIDILRSISRLQVRVADPLMQEAARDVRTLLATHEQAADLIEVGAYTRGTDASIDVAIAKKPMIDAFLRQRIDEAVDPAATRSALLELAGRRDDRVEPDDGRRDEAASDDSGKVPPADPMNEGEEEDGAQVPISA